jgi:hypothetical protein
MSTAHEHWIVTADGRRAGVFACRMTPGGNLHLDPLRSIENSHEHEHQRHRPDMIGGAEHSRAVGASSASAAPRFTSPGHEAEEMQRRFAREVGQWLAATIKELQPTRTDIFAASRFAGYLKDEITLTPTDRVHEAELANLRGPELATHPAVISALSAPRR